MTLLHQTLGIDLPIFQAPMAGSQGSALAIAVSRAGGLGALPAAMLDADGLRREMRAFFDARPGASLNVNFFCHTPPEPDAQREAAWRAALAPFYAEHGIDPSGVPTGAGRQPFSAAMAEVLEEFKPRVLSFHFGLPAPELLARVRGWGAFVISSATSVAEARWLAAHGADAIVAQGLEAGGHRGMFLETDIASQAGSLALWPQVAAASGLPMIAAGGIADAAGVRAARALGAQAVQVGTSYLLCDEATTGPVHREALAQAARDGASAQTVLTRLFSGRPARGLVNRVMRELDPMSDAPPAFPLATAAIAPLRAAAERQGRGDFSPLWCGQNPSGCRAVPAAEITRALAEGL